MTALSALGSERLRAWRIVFALSPLFNLVVGGLLLIAPRALYSWAGSLPTPTTLEPHLMGWLILVFGLCYALVAIAPERNREVAAVGVIGKLGVVSLIWLHWLTGSAPGLFAALASGDLAWSAVFLWFLFATRRSPLG